MKNKKKTLKPIISNFYISNLSERKWQENWVDTKQFDIESIFFVHELLIVFSYPDVTAEYKPRKRLKQRVFVLGLN